MGTYEAENLSDFGHTLGQTSTKVWAKLIHRCLRKGASVSTDTTWQPELRGRGLGLCTVRAVMEENFIVQLQSPYLSISLKSRWPGQGGSAVLCAGEHCHPLIDCHLEKVFTVKFQICRQEMCSENPGSTSWTKAEVTDCDWRSPPGTLRDIRQHHGERLQQEAGMGFETFQVDHSFLWLNIVLILGSSFYNRTG